MLTDVEAHPTALHYSLLEQTLCAGRKHRIKAFLIVLQSHGQRGEPDCTA